MCLWRALPWLLALVCPVAAQTRPSIAARLDAKEKQLEDLYADYWRTEYRIALGDETLSSRPIQDQIRAVVTDSQFLHDLKAAQFRDPLLKRRRALYLEEATYTQITNDPTLTAIVEEITRQENAIRYKVGDQQLTRAELSNLVAHNPDRDLRRQAWNARAQITALNGERIRQAIKQRNQLATRYTDGLFSTFLLRRKGVQTERLFDWFEQLRSQTEGDYRDLLEQVRSELHIDQVEPWDLEYYFSTLTNDFEQKAFLPAEGWATTRQLVAGLGFDLDQLPVKVQVADLSFGGAAYPILYGKDVRILANRYSGIYFYDRLWHATGHALHYSMVREPSFLLRANFAEPFDEGLAQMIALMLYRPEVDTTLFGLTPEQARVVAETYKLKAMFQLRDTMADSLFEFEAYADPDQDLAALYDRIHSKYLGVNMHDAAVWAYNPFYGSDPIYLQSYVVAEMVARQISRTLDQKFGRTWGKNAGAYLRSRFYSRGAQRTLDGIMRNGTGESVSARNLVEYFHASGPAEAARPRPAGRVKRVSSSVPSHSPAQ
jgi:oligoendopeptidase F